jgi:hypothetical protein
VLDRIRNPRHPVALFGLALLGAVLVGLGKSPWAVFVAAVFMYLIFVAGMAMLGGLSRPVPEPPPAGELRKVKIAFRCSLCGTEVRMTVSPNEEPQPPRHCQEDMDLLAPID